MQRRVDGHCSSLVKVVNNLACCQNIALPKGKEEVFLAFKTSPTASTGDRPLKIKAQKNLWDTQNLKLKRGSFRLRLLQLRHSRKHFAKE